MKPQNLFMIALMAIVMFNCSSDDDSNDAVAVEGTWRLTSFTTVNAYDFNEDGTASNDVMAETDCLQNETIVFNAGGTGTLNFNSYIDITVVIDVNTSESSYFVDCVQESESYPITWAQTGNVITIDDDGDIISFALSGNQISFTIPQGFDFEDEENGAVVEVTEDVTFVYTKQ